jgi:hypothetical protein
MYLHFPIFTSSCPRHSIHGRWIVTTFGGNKCVGQVGGRWREINEYNTTGRGGKAGDAAGYSTLPLMGLPAVASIKSIIFIVYQQYY